MSICTGLNELQLRNESYLSLYKEILARSKKSEHSGIKLVTTGIDRDNIELVKMFLDGGVQIRDVRICHH